MGEIYEIDPNELLAVMGRKVGGGRKISEVVSYYRRPMKTPDGRPIGQPGWIIWSDTQAGKRDDLAYRGFVPLFHFGRIWDGVDSRDPVQRRDAELSVRFGPWGPILSRPDGPRQFPVEQIITYRWYRPELVGSPTTHEPMRHVRFPQLKQAMDEGLTIQEYLCPDCEAVTYLKTVHLARHLRNSHDWDRQDLLLWGDAMGINFREEFKPRKIALVDYDLEPEPEVAAIVEPPPTVDVVTMPTLSQALTKSKQCLFCVKAKAGYCKKHKPIEASA